MFYATRTQAKDVDPAFGTEAHVVKFYTKADRAGYLAKHKEAQAVTAQQSRGMMAPWGLGYTVQDRDLDCVYFVCIAALMPAKPAKKLMGDPKWSVWGEI